MLSLRSVLRVAGLTRLSIPNPPHLRPLHGAGSQRRSLSSFRETLMSAASSIANPFIKRAFKLIHRNEVLEQRFKKFSQVFPDWEGPEAFVEGCGGALQALMELTNNRCYFVTLL